MPVNSFVVTRPSKARRQNLVPTRPIELTPPKHGEKPFEQLVRDSFDGPVLRLSQRMRLLEEAENRKIRRGDAIDLIAMTRQELEAKHAVKKPSKARSVAIRFGAFAAVYAAAALAWCLVVSA